MKHLFMGAVAALALTAAGAASAQTFQTTNTSGNTANTTSNTNNTQSGINGSIAVNGGFSNNSGDAASLNISFSGNGATNGSSASGFNTTLGGSANNATASFQSNGNAYSQTAVTPFEVTTQSNHSGFATGSAANGGAFSASVQTFGQSNGGSAFNTSLNAGFSSYENQAAYGNLAANLAGFEATQTAFSSFTQSDNHANQSTTSFDVPDQ